MNEAAPKPRRVLASVGASIAWLGPPVVVALALSSNHSEQAMGRGLLLAFMPVAILVGAGFWFLVGSNACSRGAPTRWRFVRRAATLFALIGAAWGLRIAWGGPFGELVFLPVLHGAVLGTTAIPAALVWWWLGIKPLQATGPASN